ncbi:MAG: twin-arginine translocation protein TatA/E family subunit [Frankiales bacterium]|jgi:sec-independent protein translocase protein TatA|nr:twin-arginine translocation protein TatA/E family subunit [Frankiales bacterium]
MPDLGKPEILILLIVILVLFGAKRLPGAARSLGQSLRIFKAETKGLRGEDDPATPPAALPTAGTPGTMPVPPVPPAVQDQQAPPLHQ